MSAVFKRTNLAERNWPVVKDLPVYHRWFVDAVGKYVEKLNEDRRILTAIAKSKAM